VLSFYKSKAEWPQKSSLGHHLLALPYLPIIAKRLWFLSTTNLE
jgi:hypothetical protein